VANADLPDATSCDPSLDPTTLGCLTAGVCAAAVVKCNLKGLPECDYTGVAEAYDKDFVCDGLDNDCDGLTDEDLSPPPATKQGGACSGALAVCGGSDGWKEPEYSDILAAYEATETSCDGVDNDCDGATDGGLDAPPASFATGVCAGTKRVCEGASGWIDPPMVSVEGYGATPETACNGIDDDCDGATDEEAACPLWQSPGRGSGRIALSPDGTRLLLSLASTVLVLDVQSGAVLRSEFSHTSAVSDVAWAPGGEAAWSVGADQLLRGFDAGSGAVSVAVDTPGGEARAIAVSPDGSKLALAESADGAVRVRWSASGLVAANLLGHEGPPRAVDWARGGDNVGLRLVSGAEDQTVRLWELESGAQLAQLATLEGPVVAVSCSPTAPHCAAASAGLVGRWDVDVAAALGPLAAVPGTVAALAYAPDGGSLAVLLTDRSVIVIDAVSGAPKAGLPAAKAAPGAIGTDLAYTPDGAAIWLACDRDGPFVRSIAGGAWSSPVFRHSGPIRAVAATTLPGAPYDLATASDDLGVRTWTSTGGAGGVLLGHSQPVRSVATVPDGSVLASGALDATVRVWSGAAGTNLKSFGTGAWVASVGFTPGADPALLAAAGASLSARNPWTGKSLWAWAPGSGLLVGAFAVRADGARFAVFTTDAGGAHDVRELETASLDTLWTSPWTGPDAAIARSPDGALLAVSGGPSHAALIEADSGAVSTLLVGHTSPVRVLAFSPSGTRLATGSDDGSARVWDVASGKPRALLVRHCAQPCAGVSVRALTFAGESLLVTGGDDASLVGWSLGSSL